MRHMEAINGGWSLDISFNQFISISIFNLFASLEINLVLIYLIWIE